MEDLIYIVIFISLFGGPILGLSILEKYLMKRGINMVLLLIILCIFIYLIHVLLFPERY